MWIIGGQRVATQPKQLRACVPMTAQVQQEGRRADIYSPVRGGRPARSFRRSFTSSAPSCRPASQTAPAAWRRLGLPTPWSGESVSKPNVLATLAATSHSRTTRCTILSRLRLVARTIYVEVHQGHIQLFEIDRFCQHEVAARRAQCSLGVHVAVGGHEDDRDVQRRTIAGERR